MPDLTCGLAAALKDWFASRVFHMAELLSKLTSFLHDSLNKQFIYENKPNFEVVLYDVKQLTALFCDNFPFERSSQFHKRCGHCTFGEEFSTKTK